MSFKGSEFKQEREFIFANDWLVDLELQVFILVAFSGLYFLVHAFLITEMVYIFKLITRSLDHGRTKIFAKLKKKKFKI